MFLSLQDLYADSIVMFQRKTAPLWNLVWCFVVPVLVSVYGWGETWWLAALETSSRTSVVLLTTILLASMHTHITSRVIDIRARSRVILYQEQSLVVICIRR